MKNKIVTRMLACLMASAILATTVAGGVVLQPVTVMAEETDCIWSAEAKDTNKVAFGDAEDWDTWDNTLKATFDGNFKKISKDSVLSFDMIMDTTAYETMKESDYIKLQAVFFVANNDWDSVVKLGWPQYSKSAFKQNADGNYSTTVSMQVDSDVSSFYSVLIQGVGTGFNGKVTIANAKITSDESDAPVLEQKDPITVAAFQENIDGWASEAGWDYSHGKENPVKNDATPTETAEVSWDEASQSLKMSLDYSKDTGTGWSEAKVTGNFNPVNISNYNIVTFKLRYPSSMDSIRTKLFMKSTDETEILNAEGSFRSKTVEAAGDGW